MLDTDAAEDEEEKCGSKAKPASSSLPERKSWLASAASCWPGLGRGGGRTEPPGLRFAPRSRLLSRSRLAAGWGLGSPSLAEMSVLWSLPTLALMLVMMWLMVRF